MITSTLDRIEIDIAQLSFDDQVWLMERMAHRLRQHSRRPLLVQDSDLLALAADPAIQHELQQIRNEFAATQ